MSNKKSYRIEKTLYKDQMIVIHIQKDKAIFSITFAENISMDEKEEIILKIKNALNC